MIINIVKNLFVINLIILFIIFDANINQPQAKKLTSEARSVIQRIQSKGSSLSGELSGFHREFTVHAKKIIEIEAMIEDLQKKGYLGKKYSDTPEKYERVYAELAKHTSNIKNTFIKHFPRIQSAVEDFNRSVYMGKDRIAELRSDDLAVVEVELRRSNQILQKIKNYRDDLENTCPKNSNMSRSCKQRWRNYERQLINLKRRLIGLKHMKQISNLKNSIGMKISSIMDQYVHKESNIVERLVQYLDNFEYFASFIGSNELGGMLHMVRELDNLNKTMNDFQKFQKGLDIVVTNMGDIVDKRLGHFLDNSQQDINVESRGEFLGSYEDKENELANIIRQLGGN